MKNKTKIALTLATVGLVSKVVLSTKHYLTVYEENSKLYAESWLQLDVFDRSYCFSKKKKEIINNKKTLKSETVLTDAKNYSSIKITPNSIELRVEKIKS